MHWEKSPPELVEGFAAVLARYPMAEQRKMFGYPAAFANGQMFTGLHERRWVVRLPDEARIELLAMDGAAPFEPMPGRPMKEYVVFPPAIVADLDALQTWIGRALAYVAALPPKR
ncbi:MAG: hypothetical protein A2X23_08955 [Chloroflexi bacterium GWC2_73_18]|nr:MAG: hypothetical protein A2X23_08955 [Chloroflexi bacterium GWC2_73_18]